MTASLLPPSAVRRSRWIAAALLLAAALSVPACATLPERERAEAEEALQAMVAARRCRTPHPKAMAAEELMNQAREKVNAEEYAEARELFSRARTLAEEAEREAQADPDCQEGAGEGGEDTDGSATLLDPGTRNQAISGDGLDAGQPAVPGAGSDYPVIYFDYNAHALSDTSKSQLDQVASRLLANGRIRLRVLGHCDERGSEEYNLSLGERRAASVRDYLTRIGGVAVERLEVQSYGEEMPADPGHGEAAWSRNRRVEFEEIPGRPVSAR